MLKLDYAIVYGKANCQYCTSAKNLLTAMHIPFDYKELDKQFGRQFILDRFPGATTYPQIVVIVNSWVRDLGGYEELRVLISRMELEEMLTEHVMRITEGDEEYVCTLKWDKIQTEIDGKSSTEHSSNQLDSFLVWNTEKKEWINLTYSKITNYEIV